MLRRTIFSAVLFFKMGVFAIAQNNFETGIHGGPNCISLWGKNLFKEFYQPAFAYSGGFFGQYAFSEKFSLRAELGYERKGDRSIAIPVNFADSQGNSTGTGTVRFWNYFDYSTAHLLFRTTLDKKIKLFFNGGLFAGYLLRQTTVSEAEGFIAKHADNYTHFYNKFDFGLSGGTGVIVPLKEKTILSFELRNDLGMANMLNKGLFSSLAMRNNSASILIGLAYKLARKTVN
jgi:hypothetical protein